MQPSNTSPEKKSLQMDDILYVLFRHKWMILILSLLGFTAAGVVYLKQRPLYQSEAKLLVRYVLQRGSLEPYETQKSPSEKATDPVINTEIEILTSADLAIDVAKAIGPGKLLPDSEGAPTTTAAAGRLLANLSVFPGRSANVLHLYYGDKERDMPQYILANLVECYFTKHLDIHRSAAAFDDVAQQAKEAKARLQDTEDELNQLRAESGIMCLADATGALTSQRSKTEEELLGSRAELAEQKASIGEFGEDAREDPVDQQYNATIGNSPRGNGRSNNQEPPPQVITEYRSLIEIIGFLQKRDLELRVKFKPGNRLILLNRQQLDTNDTKRRALEQLYPVLIANAESLVRGGQDAEGNWILKKAGIAAVEAKIALLNEHLNEIGRQFSSQYALGARIESIQRKRDIEEAEYRTLDTNLKNARLDLTLDPSRMPNITVVQQPSEPIEKFDPLTQKIIFGLAGSGVFLGLGLAFVIELLLDRRIKRPIEIQSRLQLPLMLTIPYLGGRTQDRLRISGDQDFPLLNGNHMLDLAAASTPTTKAPAASSEHFILPYAETLRDRINFNFVVNNNVHKPKFVAVTGLSAGAGASIIAAGLAKAFSEIEDTKVLLVDLSSSNPEQNPIAGEVPLLSLAGALEVNGKNNSKEAAGSLHYASALARRDKGGLRTFTPIQLYNLMPHLEASAYDYIIFDMPAIHETSRTLAMAGMMDKVLLVLDADNTSRDALTWGYSELVKGKADVSCIFNKTRNYSPSWLCGGN
jgi:uncharacterized protein involved in exopolysaccharide biosynthesis/Mrp family chromosome partitioning ATPase